jgi:transcriptional regulator with XRE-family HTH domain
VKVLRLREWREASGETQVSLAEISGVSEFTIIRSEHGESLRPSTAKKLAEAMGIEVFDLMDNPPVPRSLGGSGATGRLTNA